MWGENAQVSCWFAVDIIQQPAQVKCVVVVQYHVALLRLVGMSSAAVPMDTGMITGGPVLTERQRQERNDYTKPGRGNGVMRTLSLSTTVSVRGGEE